MRIMLTLSNDGGQEELTVRLNNALSNKVSLDYAQNDGDLCFSVAETMNEDIGPVILNLLCFRI